MSDEKTVDAVNNAVNNPEVEGNVSSVESSVSVFVTEDDVFTVTLRFYKEKGKMYVSGIDEDFDPTLAKDEFSAVFKYPSQADSELINSMAKQNLNSNNEGVTVPDFIRMEVSRMMVLIRKWSVGAELTSEKIYQLHPKIVKGLIALVRQEIGIEGIA